MCSTRSKSGSPWSTRQHDTGASPDDDDDEPFEQIGSSFERTSQNRSSLNRASRNRSSAYQASSNRSAPYQSEPYRSTQNPTSANQTPADRTCDAAGSADASDISNTSGTQTADVSPDRSAKPSRGGRPPRSLKGRALGYLSRREHSRSELQRKLTPYVMPEDGDDPLPALLDGLEKDGWLSNQRFTESVIHRRAGRFGTARIVNELKRHQIDASALADANAQLRESEWSRIRAVWQRKFGQRPDSPQVYAKQARFLAARGFSPELIRRLLRTDGGRYDEDDSAIGDRGTSDDFDT